MPTLGTRIDLASLVQAGDALLASYTRAESGLFAGLCGGNRAEWLAYSFVARDSYADVRLLRTAHTVIRSWASIQPRISSPHL